MSYEIKVYVIDKGAKYLYLRYIDPTHRRSLDAILCDRFQSMKQKTGALRLAP